VRVVGAAGLEPRADLELVRVSVAPDGAFGVILAEGVPAGPVTLERSYPIDDAHPRGAQFVKIPAGSYLCRRTLYHAGGYDTYEVTGVEGHDHLLFHRGTAERDSEGCILLGQRFGLDRGRPAVLEPALGFAVFLRLVGDRQSFNLGVRAVS